MLLHGVNSRLECTAEVQEEKNMLFYNCYMVHLEDFLLLCFYSSCLLGKK